MDIDPKLSWALRNLHLFPLDINRCSKEMLSRIPGVGMKSVRKIINARRYRKLNWEHLKKIGIALNRSRYFITCDSTYFEKKDLTPLQLKNKILQESSSKYSTHLNNQLTLFHDFSI